MSNIEIQDAGWAAIMAAPELARARQKLSFHEIRLIVDHARREQGKTLTDIIDGLTGELERLRDLAQPHAYEELPNFDDLDLPEMHAMIDELAALAGVAADAGLGDADGVADERMLTMARRFSLDETGWTGKDIAEAICIEFRRLARTSEQPQP